MGITKGDLIRVGFKDNVYKLTDYLELQVKNKIIWLVTNTGGEISLGTMGNASIIKLIELIRTCKI